MTINRHICFTTIILLGEQGKLAEWPPDTGRWPCGLSVLGGCRGKQSVVMKTPLSRRSCLIVKCMSLLHSVCPVETVTAALTPSSFVGPQHPGKESKGICDKCPVETRSHPKDQKPGQTLGSPWPQIGCENPVPQFFS